MVRGSPDAGGSRLPRKKVDKGRRTSVLVPFERIYYSRGRSEVDGDLRPPGLAEEGPLPL